MSVRRNVVVVWCLRLAQKSSTCSVEEDLSVGDLAVDESEGIAVLGVESFAASLGGDAGACEEVVVVGEYGRRREFEGAVGLVAEAGEGFDEAFDAVELAGGVAGAENGPLQIRA